MHAEEKVTDKSDRSGGLCIRNRATVRCVGSSHQGWAICKFVGCDKRSAGTPDRRCGVPARCLSHPTSCPSSITGQPWLSHLAALRQIATTMALCRRHTFVSCQGPTVRATLPLRLALHGHGCGSQSSVLWHQGIPAEQMRIRTSGQLRPDGLRISRTYTDISKCD